MHKQILFLLLSFLSIHLYGQKAEELNEKSKELIAQQKFEEAFPLLLEAAEMGNAESQYNLGYSYRAGLGTEQDIAKGVEWFNKAAEQGFNDGLYQMMMAYGNGDGVDQDYTKAFEYAVKCAENGDSTCMWNVVNCYYSGMGVDKNMDKMLEWATRLGRLENPEDLSKSGYITSTRLQLAQMYRDGSELEKDLFKSYQWYLIFNEFKRDFSYIQQQQIVKEIKDLEAELTPDQKANGPIEAEKLLGRPLKNIENLHTAEF